MLIDAFLNLLFPVSCVLCRQPVLERRWGAACPDCWSRLEPLAPPFCPQCGFQADAIEGRCGACRLEQWAFDFARSALIFNDPVRELIHHLKYSGRVSLAAPLGAALKECLDREPFSAEAAIVPAPLYRSRERQRGFNQAELLASRLGRPVMSRLLRRRKNTLSQTGLTRSQRAANLRGAFEARGAPPEVAIVVDDVYTTGATLNEMARALKRAGTRRVEALTVARVPLRGE
ncbi:MAG TPA: ComF family protein [Terriglobia bacterium]|nr:ComF family protein [Terriglobia bacterium]